MATIKKLNTVENTEEVKDQETPAETPEETTTEKRGFFRTVGHAIATPFRWIGGKIKESPAAAGIGVVIGAGAGVGGKILYDVVKAKRGDPDETTEDELTEEATDYANPYEDEAV